MNGKEQAQLDGHNFSPANIVTILVPPRNEPPSIPFVTEDDSNPPRGRGIYLKFNGRYGGWPGQQGTYKSWQTVENTTMLCLTTHLDWESDKQMVMIGN